MLWSLCFPNIEGSWMVEGLLSVEVPCRASAGMAAVEAEPVLGPVVADVVLSEDIFHPGRTPALACCQGNPAGCWFSYVDIQLDPACRHVG